MKSNRESYGLTEAFEASGFWLSFMPHAVVAMLGSFMIGFLPEASMSRYYYNTILEPYSPVIFAVAVLLGFVINAKFGHSSAMCVWFVGVMWLLFGMYDESGHWQENGAVSRLAFINNNFFGVGTRCSESECLDELFYTTPFAASVAYSIGAAVGYLVYRHKEKVWMRT